MSKSFPDSVAELSGSTSINQSKWGEELLKQFLASSGQINDMWKAISADVTNRTVITKVQGNPSVEYKTHIRIDGDIIKEFPSNPPDENDIYWKRHKDNVDEALAIRKEIAPKGHRRCRPHSQRNSQPGKHLSHRPGKIDRVCKGLI